MNISESSGTFSETQSIFSCERPIYTFFSFFFQTDDCVNHKIHVIFWNIFHRKFVFMKLFDNLNSLFYGANFMNFIHHTSWMTQTNRVRHLYFIYSKKNHKIQNILHNKKIDNLYPNLNIVKMIIFFNSQYFLSFLWAFIS